MDMTPERLAALFGPDQHSLTIIDVEPIVVSNGTHQPVLIVDVVHDELAEPFTLALRFVNVPMLRRMGETAVAVATYIEGET
jgi:hypothetical protein